jgi:hypothetical protein
VELEKNGLVQWDVSLHNHAYAAAGKSGEISIELSYLNIFSFDLTNFTRLSVSLAGNGALELNRNNSPEGSLHGIAYLMGRTRKIWDSKEKACSAAAQFARDRQAEESAREILGHLSAQSASRA